ncbi:MAG: 5-oxoprolinase subunit PxpB [Schwartzia sp.]|nr:5-oxoprolinase subunit PxpB [Schwartzia sp. (in: firmicutes)]
MEMRIMPEGDRALVVDFGEYIDETVNDSVNRLARKIQEHHLDGIQEMIPTFRSLLILFDPERTSMRRVRSEIERLDITASESESKERRILRIPCCYGGKYGEDLKDMEQVTGLSREEIISIHSGTDYRVYMLGFLPGFAYLGGLDERIAAPRLKTPRLSIPAGSVAIGGNQTGVYPIDSPGGWRIIGSTPIAFYDPSKENPILCKAGDYIRFVPIREDEYDEIREHPEAWV